MRYEKCFINFCILHECMCRPPFGAHFLQLDFAKCHDLKEPRVHAWLAVGAPDWCFLWPTRGRHVSKESAKSCRRLEERGGQLLGLSFLAVGG